MPVSMDAPWRPGRSNKQRDLIPTRLTTRCSRPQPIRRTDYRDSHSRGAGSGASVARRRGTGAPGKKWEGVPTLSTWSHEVHWLTSLLCGSPFNRRSQKKRRRSRDAVPIDSTLVDGDYSPLFGFALAASASGVTAFTAACVAEVRFDSAASKACLAALLKVS